MSNPNPQFSKISQSIREIKNKLAHNYYQFRLNSNDTPYDIRFRRKPYKILFILSHMRSGSSLLTHILNSNPEIIGYGETHLNYSSELDFKSLLFQVYWQMRDYSMTHSYVLDKVLHNHKFLNDTFLTNSQVYSIFLLREPKRTLSSILDIKPDWSEEKALNYYIERLITLEKYAKLINNKDRSLFITYDQLVNDSNLVFDQFKIFLKTRKVFSEKYQTLRTTGMKGVGDSSQNIQKGRIIRNTRQLNKNVSQELIEQAQKSFNHCHETLSQYCLVVPYN